MVQQECHVTREDANRQVLCTTLNKIRQKSTTSEAIPTHSVKQIANLWIVTWTFVRYSHEANVKFSAEPGAQSRTPHIGCELASIHGEGFHHPQSKGCVTGHVVPASSVQILPLNDCHKAVCKPHFIGPS